VITLLSIYTALEVRVHVVFFPCLAGYTSLGMALAMPEGGRVYALDINDEYASIGGEPALRQLCY
jgi:predicted O-methyltransferase YrrM